MLRQHKPEAPFLILIGHQADGTIWCSSCGLIGQKKLPCDHSPENEHIRSHS